MRRVSLFLVLFAVATTTFANGDEWLTDAISEAIDACPLSNKSAWQDVHGNQYGGKMSDFVPKFMVLHRERGITYIAFTEDDSDAMPFQSLAEETKSLVRAVTGFKDVDRDFGREVLRMKTNKKTASAKKSYTYWVVVIRKEDGSEARIPVSQLRLDAGERAVIEALVKKCDKFLIEGIAKALIEAFRSRGSGRARISAPSAQSKTAQDSPKKVGPEKPVWRKAEVTGFGETKGQALQDADDKASRRYVGTQWRKDPGETRFSGSGKNWTCRIVIEYREK